MGSDSIDPTDTNDMNALASTFNRIAKSLWLLLATIAVTGCQTTPTQLDTSGAAHGKRIGVWVSDALESRLESRGFSILSPLHGTAPLAISSGTTPDDMGEQLLAKLRNEGWQASRLPLASDEIFQAEVTQRVLAESRQQKLSYTLLVLPDRDSDCMYFYQGYIEGLGLYQRELVAGQYMRASFASLKLLLYDSTRNELVESATVHYCRHSPGPLYSPDVDTVELTKDDAAAVAQLIRETAAAGLWRLGLANTAREGTRFASNCNAEAFEVPSDGPLLAPEPPAELVARIGEPIHTLQMSCSSPYPLTRDCSSFSGATRAVQVGNKELQIAASADGRAVLVVRPGLTGLAGVTSLWNPTLGLLEVADALDRRGATISKIRTVGNSGRIVGYVLEIDGDGYRALTSPPPADPNPK